LQDGACGGTQQHGGHLDEKVAAVERLWLDVRVVPFQPDESIAHTGGGFT